MERLKDKIAIVTGGAGGIGEAICSAFLREGAHVCVAEISLERAQDAVQRLGDRAAAYGVDVRDIAAIDRLVKSVDERFGGIDILVNSAAVVGVQQFMAITPEMFDRVMSVNARGSLFMTQRVARVMIDRGRGGAIINISSGAGRRGGAAGSYSASKAALINLTQTAATELMRHKIRINAIAPGAVLTPLWEEVRDVLAKDSGRSTAAVETSAVAANPSGRLAVPEDVAGAAVFLASAESAYIVGETINVNGGSLMN